MRPIPELLPTTMVGSYPRPRWFTHQLDGRDVFEAFKSFPHTEAYVDATRAALKDQEQADLDIVTDGQMWFDDYQMGIGSFFWAERIRKVLRFVSPERVTVTTDCGMKVLPRPVARAKLASLVEGAKLVRNELTGVRE